MTTMLSSCDECGGPRPQYHAEMYVQEFVHKRTCSQAFRNLYPTAMSEMDLDIPMDFTKIPSAQVKDLHTVQGTGSAGRNSGKKGSRGRH